MRLPGMSIKAHEAGMQTAASKARSREVEQQLAELRDANKRELRQLAVKATVLLTPTETAHSDPTDIQAARERFRAPIQEVEASARDRFVAVAEKVGVAKGSAKRYNQPYWTDYFNFIPHSNKNTTKRIPLVSTAAGAIAVELGAAWMLTPYKGRNQPNSEAVFFAKVTNKREAEEPEDIGYVRLGRVFRRSDLETSALDRGARPDLSYYPGWVVLGNSKIDEEKDYLPLAESDPVAQAGVLGQVERAASAFTVLSEAAAVQAGVETHAIDANALFLAIDAVRR